MKSVLSPSFLFPLLIAACVLGAFFCGVMFRGFDAPIFAPAIILTCVAAALLLVPGLRRGWSFPAAPAAGFLFLFWLWMAWSLSWSDVPYISMIFFMTIGALPLLFFSVLQYRDVDRVITMLWAALAVGGSALAIWAVVQFLFLSELAGTRIHHPMLNANNLAVILSLNFFVLLGFFSRARTPGQLAIGVLMIFCIIGIMATQSRGGSLGLVTGGAIFILLCRATVQKQWRAFLVFGIVSMVAILFILMNLYVAEQGELRLIGLGEGGQASINERYMLWGSAFRMILDQPFPGPGLGVFYLLYPRFRNLDDTSDGYFLHVDPWQFGIEMSVIAPILFYVFGIAVLVRFIRAIRASAPVDPRRMPLVVAFCGLFSLILNAHVNFDLYMLPALLFGAVLLMRWYVATESILGTERLTLNLKNHAHAAFMIPALILLLAAAPIWIARAGYAVQEANQAAGALQRKDIGRAQDHIAAALRYGPDNYYRAYYLDALWQGMVLQDRFMVLDAGQRNALYRGGMTSLDRALRYNPYNIQALSHRALMYYTAYPRLNPDGLFQAVETLEYAMTLDPLSFDARMGLARMYEMQGRVSDAIAVLEDGNRYRAVRYYAPASYLAMLANLKAKAGDREGAEKIHQAVYNRAMETTARLQRQSAVDRFIANWRNVLLHR